MLSCNLMHIKVLYIRAMPMEMSYSYHTTGHTHGVFTSDGRNSGDLAVARRSGGGASGELTAAGRGGNPAMCEIVET